MPELLTRRETPQSIAGRVAGFKSEWWPDLFRNGGRHQIGTMAGFPSEYPAGFNRNPHNIKPLEVAKALWEQTRPKSVAANTNQSNEILAKTETDS